MSIGDAVSVKRRDIAGYSAASCAVVACAIIAVGLLLLGYYITTHGTRSAVGVSPHAGHLSSPHSQNSSVRPTVTVVSSEYLPHVPGKKITTVLLDFPPAAFVPKHHHGGSVSVYVLSGSIRSQLEGGPIGTFKTGETFFEPPGITHVFAENASVSESARVLAIFVHDEGAPLTTYHD